MLALGVRWVLGEDGSGGVVWRGQPRAPAGAEVRCKGTGEGAVSGELGSGGGVTEGESGVALRFSLGPFVQEGVVFSHCEEMTTLL